MDERVNKYLQHLKQDWQREVLTKIRKNILTNVPELNETIKWGVPYYAGKKNVLGLVAFKNHVSVWFTEGSFLKDSANILEKAQGKTKSQRQITIKNSKSTDYDLITSYIKEAAENDSAGKHTKPAKPVVHVEVIEELKNALNQNSPARDQFEGMSPSKKREYNEHIASAKREQTKIKRMQKIIPMIEKGMGLNDKYKK